MRLPAALPLVVLGLGLAPPAAQAEDVIVRYRSGTDAGERADVRRAASVARESGLPLANTELVDPATGTTAREAVAELEREPDVLYAEPDARRVAFATPGDPLFRLQWGLLNTGQTVNGTAGTAGADIRAPEAWDVTTGSRSVLIAVADTGIDGDHPDLVPNRYRNAAEASGVAARDDDGNGFVDDVSGWDFVSGDATPQDEDGHGTHVTGTVAARGNDGVGVTGVAWQASLLPLRVLGADGSGTVSDALKAYRYAGQSGARAINLSLGGDQFSRTERDVLAAQSNLLVVAAAGNDGLDTDVASSYPCEYDLPNVICVAATGKSDELASFSNYGATSVDLAAPGVDIASTHPDDEYAYLSGTSMAAPHVTGAAALGFARTPGLTAAGMRSALLASAERLASLRGKVASGARLDAAALLGVPRPAGEPAPSSPSSGGSPSPTPEPTPEPTPTPTPGSPSPTPTPSPTASPVPPEALVVRDRMAPMLTGLSFAPSRALTTFLRRGLRARLRCSEACTVRVDLLRGRTRLATRTVRATSTAALTARLRPTTRRLGPLRTARRATLTVRLRATDRSGNARTITRRLTLRR